MIKIFFLSENRTNEPECLAEHGLSIFIETNEKKILFDAGASDIYGYNAEKLNVDLEETDEVVISHGHYDHTGGLSSFCLLNKKANVYIHKNAFEKTYGMENGKLEEKQCGIRWTEEEYDSMKNRFIFTDGVTKLTDNILISGTIPDIDGLEKTESFFIKNDDGSIKADDMSHEQFLAIRDTDENGNSKGIYVFSGCSHKGVIPCIRYAKQLFPDDKIIGFIAGMHLYSANKETRDTVISNVVAEEIPFIMPVHCTGINGICELKAIMGERCIPAGAGDKFIFE